MTFSILHRDRWRRQPTGPIAIDGNHYFARGLAAAVVPTSLQDVARRLPLTLVNVTSGVGLHGRTWNFPGDGTQRVDVASPGYSLATGFAFSGFALAQSIGTSANNRQTLININFNGTTVPFNLNIGHSGVMGCGYFDGSGWRVSGITTDIRGNNRWHAVGGTVRSGAQRFYLDGRLDASNTATGTNSANNANAISFGTYQNDNASLLGGIALGLFWAGVELDGAAMRALHEAPWQWARLVTRRVYSLGAAPTGVTINCLPGDATATGSQAVVSSPITIACSVGDALAAGQTAAVSQAVTVSCSVGDATAAGSQANIASSITIACAVGDAAAAGAVATIATGNSIDCAVGDAAAAGQPATVSSAITIGAAVGDAVAAGLSASVSTATTISCAVGDASAAGLTATIAGAVTVSCSVGDALAAGVAATISTTLDSLTAAEIAEAVWNEPLAGATQARQIMSGMADFLRARGFLP